MHGADPAALDDAAITDLLAEFRDEKTLVLAVSGGSDSMGMLAAFWRWRQGLDHGPVLEIATVDHGLRVQSRGECELVVEAARRLGLPATILTWTGEKPEAGLQSAARTARYHLLADHAQSVGAGTVVTAHTLGDQAETVLMRLVRGSGPLGLSGMASRTNLDWDRRREWPVTLARPFLWVERSTLAATAAATGLPTIADPSNTDDRFTRPRMRKVIQALESEGLSVERLATLAGRMGLVTDAVRTLARRIAAASQQEGGPQGGLIYKASGWLDEPLAAVQILLAEAIAQVGNTGIDERLEAIEALSVDVLVALSAERPLNRTLRGAMISVLTSGRVVIAPEPKRSSQARGTNIGPDTKEIGTERA